MNSQFSKKMCLLILLIFYGITGISSIAFYAFNRTDPSPSDTGGEPDRTYTQTVPQEIPAATDTEPLIYSDPETESVPETVSAAAAAADTADLSYGDSFDNTTTSETAGESMTESEESESVVYTYRVNSPKRKLNIRALPSTDAEILGRLSNDSTGEVIEVGGSWTLIQTPDGICGYVTNDFLELLVQDEGADGEVE